jgi:hypothetical protein
VNTLYEVLAPLRAVADHLDRHDLPTPVGINVSVYGRTVVIQLRETGLRLTSGALLAWARTLADVTVEAWRPPTGHSVHLTVSGRLDSGQLLHVYDAVDFDAATFPDMPEGSKHDVSLTVLHMWASAGEVAA